MNEAVQIPDAPIEEKIDYSPLLNKQFKKSRHGQHQVVTLLEVGKKGVKLAEEGRKDSFTVSLKEFLKFYRMIEPRK